jgi:F-type H+-transporting ATPase subunit a
LEAVQAHLAADSLEVMHGAADTLHTAGVHAGDHGEGNLFAELLHHLQDSHELETPFGHIALPEFPPIHVAGMTIDLSITKHVVFLWIAGVILCIFAIPAARANMKRAVPRGFGNLMEVFIVFIRDEIVIPNMGPGGVRYMPYLLTTFFFILTMNLLGLIPYGASATANVSVTGALAIIAFFMIQAAAIRAQGFGHYLAHLTGGVHWALWPIMIPIEILGLFTKPFALCIRLFANMTGGHIVIVSLIGLIFIFQSYLIAIAPAGFVVGIMFLELFVAFLQAYIFTMLTSLFMGLGMKTESHGAEGEGAHGA